MNENIFREKNLKSISSPDNLNDYIRVVRPSVWATLIATILLLLCAIYWGFVGRLDSVVSTAVVSAGDKALVYVDETDG